MGINLELPKLTELKPRIVVIGVGGAGGNAINNMIASGLTGVEYVAANTDAQALVTSSAERRIQLGVNLTEGLGAGSKPDIGEAAAEEAIEEIRSQIAGAHMVFIAAGMGGGTGTGAGSVIARVARDMGVLAVGIVTKPFQFEGTRRLRTAEAGIAELKKYVDTLIVIPNQNLFRVATERTTFAEAFVLADQVLYSGVACIVDLIVKDGLINLDFADVRTVMSGMGTAMMGTGEATGERRALKAAEEAISNPLLDEVSLKGAKGVLLSIIGGRDMTLYEVDEAASRVRQEVDPEANIIVGATFDEQLGDSIRVAIVASGMGNVDARAQPPSGIRPDQPRGEGRDQSPPHPLQPTQGAALPPLPPVAQQRPQGANPQTPPLPKSTEGSAAPGQPVHASPLPPPMARPDHAQAPFQSGGAPAAPRERATIDQPERRELWRSPNDVVIEETRPQRQPATGVRQPAPAQPVAEPPADPFSPAPPEDFRRPAQRRVPDIDQFPPVGQREFKAKTGQYEAASPAYGLPPPHRNAEPEPNQRSGLLQRMMGSGRKGDSDGHADDRHGTSESRSMIPSLFSRNKK